VFYTSVRYLRITTSKKKIVVKMFNTLRKNRIEYSQKKNLQRKLWNCRVGGLATRSLELDLLIFPDKHMGLIKWFTRIALAILIRSTWLFKTKAIFLSRYFAMESNMLVLSHGIYIYTHYRIFLGNVLLVTLRLSLTRSFPLSHSSAFLISHTSSLLFYLHFNVHFRINSLHR